jgi:hypothetical protein
MPVECTVTVATATTASAVAAERLRSLRSWLSDDDSLRGRVRVTHSPPGPGTLGAIVDALVVVLGPGGVATALAAALITWIRSRHGDVEVRVRCANGAEVELSARRVRGLDHEGLRAQVALLAGALVGSPDASALPAGGGAPGPAARGESPQKP